MKIEEIEKFGYLLPNKKILFYSRMGSEKMYQSGVIRGKKHKKWPREAFLLGAIHFDYSVV